MRQTLCDGYLVIFALAQAVILLMLTPLFTGISRQIRARMHSRRGPGIWQDYRDIHKLFKRQEFAPTSSGLMFRLMPWVLISSMLVLAMAIPLFITVSPFAGGGDLITLIYLLALFRFLLCSFRAGYRKPVCGSRCQSRVDARHSGRTHAHSLTAGIGTDSGFHAYRDDQQYAGDGLELAANHRTGVTGLWFCLLH